MEAGINNSDDKCNGRIIDVEVDIEKSMSEIKDSCADDSSPLISSQSLIIYKRRWFILFIFSMNSALNGLIFMSLSPINNIAVKYYKTDAVNIEWLSTMFMVCYIVIALPASFLMSRWGVRPIITTASILHLACTVIHYNSNGRDSFWLITVGQVFAAIAYSMIIQVPGKISSQWFPEKERSTATAIGVFMNLLGVSLGFLQPSQMIRDSSDMNVIENELNVFYLLQMVVAASILLLTIAYEEKPPTPPSFLSSRHERNDFIGNLKSLWRNKYFVIFSQSYGIYFGLFVTFCVLVNPLVISKFPHGVEGSLGWMGFWCDVAAILSCLVIGILLDKYRKYQLTTIVLNTLSMLIWLAFIFVLTNTRKFMILYILYVCLGATGVPVFASGIEQAAEMTYPVSEETSSAVILVLGNTYGFIFIFSLGLAAQNGYILVAGYSMAGLYFLSTVLACFAKTQLRRSHAEKLAIMGQSVSDSYS